MTDTPKLAEVKTLYESNSRDIVKTMRLIADQIEKNEYGAPTQAVLVTFGEEFNIFGLGDANGADVYLLLGGAKAVMEKPLVDKWGG